MIHYTRKELEYQLKGEWNIQSFEYTKDQSQTQGGFFGKPRVSPSWNNKTTNLKPSHVKEVSKARVNFDEPVYSDSNFDTHFRAVAFDIGDNIDRHGLRAFEVHDELLGEYYPTHTRYKDQVGPNKHRVEFIVKFEEDFSNSLLMNKRYKIGYSQDPDHEDDDKDYTYVCEKGLEGCKGDVEIKVEPPLKVKVPGMGQFSSPREAEKKIGKSLRDCAEKLV